MSQQQERATRELLARAHSPDSVERIYTNKIQHRTLYLRPTSPPPATVNARAERRRARQKVRDRQKQKPAPLSSRERRRLGLHDIPKDGQKYELYEPLNKLWTGYIREILAGDVFVGGANAAAKLASAEFHGANVEVVRSKCPSRVGIAGIVLRDRKFVMEIITKKKGVKVVPKEGTMFRFAVDVPSETNSTTETESKATRDNDSAEGLENPFVFDLLGDQMMVKSADRANRKFKSHFLENV
jgi:ribonuclease P protein subunit POP4